MIRTLVAGLISTVAVVTSVGTAAGSAPRGRRGRRRSVPPIGAVVRRVASRFPSLRTIRDGEIAIALFLALAGGLVVPPLLLAGPIAVGAEAIRRERRAAARRQRALVDALPEMIDQLGLAVGAGLTLPVALGQVRRWLTGPIRGLTDEALARLDAGAPLVDALTHLGRGLPENVRRPLTVIVAATRDGAPLGPSLARAAEEARQARRREAEVRARRLPVLMLLPLVLCVLPAFVLLTLVPLVVGSLDGLAITDGFPEP